jgi:aspartate/methionine/tyrosine aminotransferase
LGFASALVKNARVGVAPGSAFGAAGDKEIDSFIRICFAQDPARLQVGLERLGKAISAL